MKSLLLGLALIIGAGAGCSKRREEAAELPRGQGPAIPAAELERGEDACTAYVTQVCACAETVPAAQRECALARALPEALRIAAEVGASQDSKRVDVAHSAASLRKTIANCIQSVAALPTLGCR